MAHVSRAARALWVVLALVALSTAAFGQSSVQITGAFSGTTPESSQLGVTFTCSGAPTCTGKYDLTSITPPGVCTNPILVSDTMSISGLDLSVPGPIHFTAVFHNGSYNDTKNPDGTCSISSGSQSDVQVTFDGGWDGSVGGGTFTHVGPSGDVTTLSGGFTATGATTRPPPFDMTVTSNITQTTASATAQVQFPATDQGKRASIYVFAYAPRSLVKSALLTKDGGDNSCLLAQPDATGQLTQASASNLQPYLSNVVLGASQSVTVLNNASTPANAGATYFVGYGSDAGSMISGGVNRSAVTIPGSVQCPDQFPATPDSLSGLWSDVAEQGWGIHFTQRGVHVFAAWFTYDASGDPKWYVASGCTMASSHLTSGRCSGDLYEVSGARFFGVPFDATVVKPNPVGTLQVDFGDPSHATMTYTASGVTRTVPIVRQAIRNGTTPPAVDYTDLWWNANESGWGLAIGQQYDVMFLAWFVYDDAGKPTWYVASDCAVSGNGCSGALYRVTGPPFGPTFDHSAVHANPVGTVNLIFTDPNDGLINYTVNGVSASKAITRQIF